MVLIWKILGIIFIVYLFWFSKDIGVFFKEYLFWYRDFLLGKLYLKVVCEISFIRI